MCLIYQNLTGHKYLQWTLSLRYYTLLISTTCLVFATILSRVDSSRQQFKVHWNISNPIFRIDNTDNVIDVNKGNAPWEHDQVHILCPFYKVGTKNDNEIEKEKYVIYNVNKEEYETCIIRNPIPRL